MPNTRVNRTHSPRDQARPRLGPPVSHCPFADSPEFEIRPSDYAGDGSRFLKLAFDDVGEIDFIVGHALTDTPTTRQIIEGEEVDLETVAEIITKKIHHRDSRIRPRDIFDIAAAATHFRQTIIDSLKAYKNDVARTLTASGT